MTIARSTGALVGTSETVGRNLAAGATFSGAEVDLLADATSTGILHLYLAFSKDANVVNQGEAIVRVFRARLTGLAEDNPIFSAAVRYDRTGKVYLGSVAAPRFASAKLINGMNGDLINGSVLYELEKTS